MKTPILSLFGCALLVGASHGEESSLQAPLPEITIEENGESVSFKESEKKIEEPKPVETKITPPPAVPPAAEWGLGKPAEVAFEIKDDKKPKPAPAKTTKPEKATPTKGAKTPVEIKTDLAAAPIQIVDAPPVIQETPVEQKKPLVIKKTVETTEIEEALPDKAPVTTAPQIEQATLPPVPPISEPIFMETPEPKPTAPVITDTPKPAPTKPIVEILPTPTIAPELPVVVEQAPIAPTPVAPTPPPAVPQPNLDLPLIPNPTAAATTKQAKPDLADLMTPENPGTLDPNAVEALIEHLQTEGRRREAARTSLVPNLKQDEINFDNVPLGSVLRLLAEQAGFNFIEPAIPEDEFISLRLRQMTALQAFMHVAHTRGFSIITKDNVTTLTRSDIKTPEFLIIRKYNLRHIQPKWVIQQVVNLMGIDMKSPASVLASYPKPEKSTAFGGGGGGGGSSASSSSSGGGSGGGSQNIGLSTSPRWESSLPFDEPAYKGKDDKYAFIDRASRAIVVRGTESDHSMLKQYFETADTPEPQIMIETKIVEILVSDDLQMGADWSTMLQKGMTLKAEGTKSFNWGDVVLGASSGGSGQLTMTAQNAEVTVRAFQTMGNGTVSNMPKTMTRSNVPVSISSTVTDSRASAQFSTGSSTTAGSTVSAPSGYNTFTTGMTIDLVPQLMANGMVDINLNPSMASNLENDPTKTPTISSRTITTSASVPSGMTIMVGGLTEMVDSQTSGGIPVLSKLPILGKTIFGQTKRTKARKTMILFVTPTVIYPDEYQKVYMRHEEWDGAVDADRGDIDMEKNIIPNARTVRKAIPLTDTVSPGSDKPRNYNSGK